jgi:hypothetical protein
MHQAGVVGNRHAGRRHRQNAIAQIGAGEVADLATAHGDDVLRQRLFGGTADHPDVEAALDQKPCSLRIIGPALRCADRAGRQRDRGGCA